LPIIDFFRKQKGVLFEFKTKSTQIDNLLKVKPAGNIIVSWSLNPQKIINENEYFTPSLDERLKAASICGQAGYRLAFHFDPVVYFVDWEKHYRGLLEALFQKIKPSLITWMSIGSFRFSPELKPIIERRFPENKILNEELLLSFDGKLRYPFSLRYEIYQKMREMLLRHSHKLNLYLCMEEEAMWKKLRLNLSL